MRPSLALFFSLIVAITLHAEEKFRFESTPGKLPKDIVPHSYLVHLEPNIEELLTDGVESIEIEVLKPTDHIVFNAIDTTLSAVKLAQGTDQQELAPKIDNDQQTVSLQTKQPLQPGRYTLTFKFQSKITEQPHGLFIQHYLSQGKTESLLATQMEATDARRMFPCWDEPAFRATYQLTVKTGKENSVVSNMPVAAEQPFGPKEKIVMFQQTPPMASYLVVLVSGKLEWLEDEVAGVKLRIVTTSGKKQNGACALEAAKKILAYYNDYFGVAYPLPKLDHIALPSGFGGAMENWGGITYNEDVLLYDPKASSEITRQRVFSVMAHEMAHQWFGDLVTMGWWDNLWLNEGFASWMQKKANDHFYPEWKTWLHTSNEKERAMARDSRSTTHPIQHPIANEDEAGSSFDEIAYQKGESFIRMIESYLGEVPFRDGIRTYIAANKYSNTTTANLWDALEQSTGKPVKKVAASWTEQPGFPLIKMTSQCVKGNRVVSLEQVHFNVGDADPRPLQWTIPVGIFSTAKPDEAKYALLDKLSNNFDFPGCNGVLKGNPNGTGFFRIEYEPALFDDLQNNVNHLSEADRVNFITDTWAMVESGHAAVPTYFNLLEKLRTDSSYAVWESTLGTDRTIGPLRVIDRLQHSMPGRETYQSYVCTLLAPKLAEIGWDEKPGENNEVSLFRILLIDTLGAFGEKAVIDEAFKRFEAFQKDPSALAPNLRPPVIQVVGRYSSPATFDQLISLASKAETAEEKRMYLRGLGQALDPALAKKAIDFFMSNAVSPGDGFRAFEHAAEGEHPELIWQFATNHLKDVEARFGFFGRNLFFPTIGKSLTDDASAGEVVEFTKAQLPATAKTGSDDSANLIRFHSELRARILPELDQWIAARLQTSGEQGAKGK
jgi:aminopeptidase N